MSNRPAPAKVSGVKEPVLSPAARAAQAEMASRIMSRRKLLPFIQRMNPKYLAGWVHEDICRRLERFSDDVAAGLSPRLMILMPPRAGKSEIASKTFPAWHMGRHPDHEIIACSYNVGLAMDFSKKVKAMLEDPAFQSVFDIRLDPENRSSESWGLLKQPGGYVAAGTGGGITGKGCHILIVDDSLKNAEESDSATTREGLWNWYGSTAYTRLAPGGGVLVIQTCWHDADLAGRLQTEMASAKPDDPDVDRFEVIKYPAIAEHDEYLDYETDLIVYDAAPEKGRLLRLKGEALHPARFDIKKLMGIRRTIPTRFWSALYQQNPVPDDGAYFTKDQFKRGPLPPLKTSKVYIAWDFAISEKAHNDYTVGTVGLQDFDDVLHVAEVIRFKSGDAFFIVESILSLAKRWYHPSLQLGFEDGQIYRSIEALLKKRMRETKFYPSIQVLKPITDKMARGRVLQGRMQQGMVSFNQDAEWYDTVRNEMLRFPAGVHDDCCLIAGTEITMGDGSLKMIEDIVPGDYVLTPRGACRVEAANMTNRAAEVIQLVLSNGAEITGTPDHPLWGADAQKFIPLSSFALESKIEYHETVSIRSRSWHEFTESRSPVRRSNWTGRFIAGIHSRAENTCAVISRALAPSTTRTCGSNITAPSLMGGTSTIRTGTRSTTTSVISNASRLLHMPKNTPSATTVMSSLPIWSVSDRLRRLGTRLLKGWHGTRRTAESHGSEESSTTSSVSTAELGFSPSCPRRNSAPDHAARKIGPPVTLSITSRKELGLRPVYNLTVADEHVYYANGVLSHNCDSAAWMAQMAVGCEPPKEIKAKPAKSWKDKLNGGKTGTTHMCA